jgi:hypothetical protein
MARESYWDGNLPIPQLWMAEGSWRAPTKGELTAGLQGERFVEKANVSRDAARRIERNAR